MSTTKRSLTMSKSKLVDLNFLFAMLSSVPIEISSTSEFASLKNSSLELAKIRHGLYWIGPHQCRVPWRIRRVLDTDGISVAEVTIENDGCYKVTRIVASGLKMKSFHLHRSSGWNRTATSIN